MIIARRARKQTLIVVNGLVACWSMRWSLPDSQVKLWVPVTPHEAVDLPLGAIQLERQERHGQLIARVCGTRRPEGVSWGMRTGPEALHEFTLLRVRAITEEAVRRGDDGNKHIVAGLQLLGLIEGPGDLRRMIYAAEARKGGHR